MALFSTLGSAVYCRICNVLSNVTYKMSHRQTDAPMLNTQSTFRTAPICVNIFPCSVMLFGSNGNSYQSVRCHIYVYIQHTHVLHNKENLVGQK